MSEQPPRDPYDPAEDETVVARDGWPAGEETVVETREVEEEVPLRRRLPPIWPGLLALLLLVLIGLGVLYALSRDDGGGDAAATTTTEQTTTEQTTTTTAPPEPATVPDVVGDELADAARAFGDEGLKVAVRHVPSDEQFGTVVAQAQDPGTELKRGDTVQVNVSPGADPPPSTKVPGVAGKKADDARKTLEDARFEVLAVELDGGRSGVVSSQTPPGGASVPRGSLVILYVGR